MPDYTRSALEPLLEDESKDFAWCYDMRFIENLYELDGNAMVVPKDATLTPGGIWRPSVQWKRHQSAIGTLVARRGALKEVCDHLKRNHPNGLAKVQMDPDKYSGPIDNYLRRLLQNEYSDRLTEHHATGRWYFIHTKASSKFGRRKEGYIDGIKT